jgi:hypothetical protein
VGSRARGHALVFIWESGGLTHTRVIVLIAGASRARGF